MHTYDNSSGRCSQKDGKKNKKEERITKLKQFHSQKPINSRGGWECRHKWFIQESTPNRLQLCFHTKFFTTSNLQKFAISISVTFLNWKEKNEFQKIQWEIGSGKLTIAITDPDQLDNLQAFQQPHCTDQES